MPGVLYSLIVEQQPIRARMCGFGDKVGAFPRQQQSSPLARAAGCLFSNHDNRTGDLLHHLLLSDFMSQTFTRAKKSTSSKSRRKSFADAENA